MAEYTKPLPTITSLNQLYWEGALAHELRLQHCNQCQHVWFPPSTNCPRCLSEEYTWTAVSGRGRVWSWIIMHQRYFPSFEVPYQVAFIQLDEGPFLMSTVIDADPVEMRCDLPVEVTFDRVTETIALPKFRPVRD